MKKIFLFLFLSISFVSCSKDFFYPVINNEYVCFINQNGVKQTNWVKGNTVYTKYEIPTITGNNTNDIIKYYDLLNKKWFSIDFNRKGHFEDHVYSDGLLAVKDNEIGQYGYINTQNEYEILPMYESAEPFSCGVAWVYKKNEDNNLLINKNNEVLFCTDYSTTTPYQNGYSYVTKELQSEIYIPMYDNHGNIIPGAMQVVDGDFGGIIDKKGKEIISFTLGEPTKVFDNTVRCKEKYIIDNEVSYSLFGYKNLKNEWIIKPQYVYADDFRYGYAEVSNDENDYYLINKKNQICLKNNYKFIYAISKKLFIVSHNLEDFYITNIKKEQLSEKFYLIKLLDDKMYLAKNTEGLFYINSLGKMFYFDDYN